jgi:hypothetical protein
MLGRRDLLGQDVVHTDEVLDGPIVRTLLSGQCPDGGFGVHPHRKWKGAHWRLVSLVELGIPVGEPRALRAADTVLDWQTGPEHRSSIVAVDGLARCHASQEGTARGHVEVVDWGRSAPNEMITLNALRILRIGSA